MIDVDSMRMRGIPGFREYLAAPLASAAPPSYPGAKSRIASVFDSAIVTRALERMHHVAFFAIDGIGARKALSNRAIEGLAESAFGVDKGSARASVDTASLSLAFDPRRVAFGAIQCVLDKKLAALRLTLLPIRLMDEPSMPIAAA